MAQPYEIPQGGPAPKRRRLMDGFQDLAFPGFSQPMASNQGAFAHAQAPQNALPAYTGTVPPAHSFHANQNCHFSYSDFAAQGSQSTIPQGFLSGYADPAPYQPTGAPAAYFPVDGVPTGGLYPEVPALGRPEFPTDPLLDTTEEDLLGLCLQAAPSQQAPLSQDQAPFLFPEQQGLPQQAPLSHDQAPFLFPEQQGLPQGSFTDQLNVIANTWDHPNESDNSGSAQAFNPRVDQQTGVEEQSLQPLQPPEDKWAFIDNPNLTFEVKRDKFRQVPEYRQDPNPKEKKAGRKKKAQRFWAPSNAEAIVKDRYASLQGADANVKGAEDKLASTGDTKGIARRQKTVLRNMKIREVLWEECERLEQGLPAQEMSLEEAEAKWREDLHAYKEQDVRYWAKHSELTTAHPEILRADGSIDMPKLGGIGKKARQGFQTRKNWRERDYVELHKSHRTLWEAQDRKFGTVSIKVDIFSRVCRMHEVGGVETWAEITWPGNSPLHQSLRAEFTNNSAVWDTDGPWHDCVPIVGGDDQQAQPESTETSPGLEQPAFVPVDAQAGQGQGANVMTPATNVWGTSEATYAKDGPKSSAEDDPIPWMGFYEAREQIDPAQDWNGMDDDWDDAVAAEAFAKQPQEAVRVAILQRVQPESTETSPGLEQPAIVSVNAREAEATAPATVVPGDSEGTPASDDLLIDITDEEALREIEDYYG